MPLIPSRLKWLSARVLAALPMLVSMCMAVLAVWYWQKPLMCMPLVLGVIAGGLVDLDNRLTGRIQNLLSTIAAFSVSSLTVQFTFGQPLLFLPAMTLLTFVLPCPAPSACATAPSHSARWWWRSTPSSPSTTAWFGMPTPC